MKTRGMHVPHFNFETKVLSAFMWHRKALTTGSKRQKNAYSTWPSSWALPPTRCLHIKGKTSSKSFISSRNTMNKDEPSYSDSFKIKGEIWRNLDIRKKLTVKTVTQWIRLPRKVVESPLPEDCQTGSAYKSTDGCCTVHGRRMDYTSSFSVLFCVILGVWF